MNKIQEFNEMHFSKDILFLGNAWDLLSALMHQKVGFKAISTTSWGIANSLGFADGEMIDFDRHLGIIKTIADNVKIPVSADNCCFNMRKLITIKSFKVLHLESLG